MKPTFALDLSRDSIALLHRTPKGWLSIGEVAFDAPDMAEAIDYLRKTALGLSPMGFATKIILPNSQILYTEVEAPGPSRNDKRRQIAAALEGRTPYAVDDLVFDWSGKGATVKVAVVARETLEEAEGFAVSNRLNPVSFVAIPEEGDFVGEPWFGPTVAADSILAPGEGVDRDREAVTILHRDLPAATPEEPKPEDTAQTEAPTPTPTETTAPEDEPLPGLEEALNADLSDQPPTVAAEAEAEPELVPATVLPVEEAPAAAAPPPATADDDLPESLLREALEKEGAQDDTPPSASDPAQPDTPAPDTTAAATDVATPPREEKAAIEQLSLATTADPAPEVEEAPFAHVTDTAAFPEGDDIPPLPPGLTARRGAAEEPEDDLPPAPPSAAMVAFASRRGSGAAPAAGPVGAASRSDPRPATPAARLGQPIPRPAAAKGFPGLVTAPTIPGTRAKPKGKLAGLDMAASTATGPTTVKSPARPGGTFGTVAPPRNRSGVVFMVLVALLLLFLAAIAAWSSFYLARNSEVEGNGVETALDVVPDVDDEMLADLQDPEGMDQPLPEAEPAAGANGDAGALATESLPVNIGGDEALADAEEAASPETLTDSEAGALADLGSDLPSDLAGDPITEAPVENIADAAAEPAPAATEPAPGTTVSTDLSAAQPPVEDQDEIFLSAMDAPPPALDALALPAPASTPDATPEAPMPPPAFGTVYRFGADGLLVPTPDGILSPDGVMLIAGKPPLLPPARSEAAEAAALAAAATAPDPQPLQTPEAAPADTAASPADASLVTAEDTTAVEPVASDPAMAGFRPRPRPEGLVPAADDDASLDTETNSDFAGLRPLPRPDSVLVAASASRPAETPADLGAQGASLTAQAEAQLAAAAALEAENPSIVAISKRPQGRPRDLSRAVEAAVAAAVREPEPEVIAAAAPAKAPDLKPEELDEADEPEVAVAAPKIPTKASVAKQATFANAINLSKLNLIGTYGTDSRRTALIRQANGRYKKVKVGDKIDGGTIKAITETEVRYQKGGKLLSLKMPKA